MKTVQKIKTGRRIAGFAAAATLVLSAIPAASVLHANAYGKSEEETKANDNVLTSNLVKDGSFENVSIEGAKAGAWDIDLTSSAAGKSGSVAIVQDAYVGEKAFQLHAAGNKSGYPEISQKITVLPNTTYYVAMRVRCAYVNNVFFGLASEAREGETIYGQLHRWNDTATDKDHNDESARVELVNPDDATDKDTYSAYALYSAHFTTGNETNCRLFIRVEKSAIVIDDVSVTYEGNLISAASQNLLKNGGFEESTGAVPLSGGWEALSNNAAAGAEIGIDSLNLTTFMRSTQDKQIEGLNTLYLAAKDGFTAEDNITIGQAVMVKANTNYSFSVNLSKYGDAKRVASDDGSVTAQGIQRVTVGIYAADKTTVLKQNPANTAATSIWSSQTVVDGSNISVARYTTFGTMANTGENTTVYPFIKFESASSGQWGNCLYVDDCLFYENSLDLPAGKANMLANGNFTEGDKGSDGWYICNGWDNKDDRPYISQSSCNLGVNQWYPYVGLMQSTQLTANKFYKITAYVQSWANLPSPASILVIRNSDRVVHKTMSDASNLWNGGFADQAMEKYDEIGNSVVAKQSVFISNDMFYRPINLIFSVEATDIYTILVGFDEPAQKGADGNLVFVGGINLGGISMYETSMAELSPSKETTPADVLGTLDTANIAFEANVITVSNGMPIAYFKEQVYPYGNYKVKVLDASGNEPSSGSLGDGYKVRVYVEGDEANGFEFAIAISDKVFENGEAPVEKKGCRSAVSVTGGVGAIALATGAATAIIVIKKKKQTHGNDE